MNGLDVLGATVVGHGGGHRGHGHHRGGGRPIFPWFGAPVYYEPLVFDEGWEIEDVAVPLVPRGAAVSRSGRVDFADQHVGDLVEAREERAAYLFAVRAALGAHLGERGTLRRIGPTREEPASDRDAVWVARR